MTQPTMSRTIVLAREERELAGASRVTVLAGPDAGTSVEVELPATIGRASCASVRLRDATASSIHVEVRAARDGLLVRDLESANGTVCAGVSIREATVAWGAELQMGTTLVRVEPAGAATPHAEAAEHGRLRSASPAMRGVLALLAKVSPTSLAILVEADDPSEADLVAVSIHETSGRTGAFATVDCAGLSVKIGDDLLAGALAQTAGGTLHLRGISGLAPELQLRLLEAPQSVRLVASSVGELALGVNRGAFHEEVYDRVAKVRVRVPPLRDRAEDVPAMVYATLQSIPAEVPAARTVSKEAMQLLRRREWRDARELRDVVERAAMVAAGPTVAAGDLAFERVLDRARYDVESPFKEAKRTLVDDFERAYLAALLERCGNNISRAAIASGIERHHLRDLLRKHGLYESDR